MSINKTVVIAGVAAVATTAAVRFLCLKGHIGGEGPGDVLGWIGIIFFGHLILLVSSFGITNSVAFETAVGALGFFQSFMAYWVLSRVLTSRGEPAAAPTASPATSLDKPGAVEGPPSLS